jgi:hypothetical protein
MALDRDGTFVDPIVGSWTGTALNLPAATIKCALFTSSLTPNFSQSSPAYGTSPLNSGEVTGTGYTAGGVTLTSVTLAENGSSLGTIRFTAAAVSWTSASFTAHGALIYLSSVSNKALTVRSFTQDLTVQDGTFTITWHTNGIWSVPLIGPVVG